MDRVKQIEELLNDMKLDIRNVSDTRFKSIVNDLEISLIKISEESTKIYKHVMRRLNHPSKGMRIDFSYVYDFKSIEEKMKKKNCMVVKVHMLIGYFVFENMDDFQNFMTSNRFKSPDHDDVIYKNDEWIGLDFYMVYQIIQSEEKQKVILGCTRKCNVDSIRRIIKECFKCDADINPNELYDMYEIVLNEYVDKYSNEYYFKLLEYLNKENKDIKPHDVALLPELSDPSGIMYRQSTFYPALATK